MASSSSESKKEPDSKTFKNFAVLLNNLYIKSLKPLEDAYNFPDFHSSPLEDADFDCKPIILFVGQYSTGKTTFIRYLLEKDFPGMRIGPEPTTDSFHAIMDAGVHGVSDEEILGNILVYDKTKPFGMFSSFGNGFLSRLKCSLTDGEVIQDINIIDTPGILSGEKQKVKRGYDYAKVMKLLAERVDRIILLFDAFKLDISDEFHEVINAIKDQHSKVRVVLNKADQVSTKELMRVYGALMWSLGKVIPSPEVVRIYIGSFWDKPFQNDDNALLFASEKDDLFADIKNSSKSTALTRLNDFVKRANLAKIHAYIIDHLYSEIPYSAYIFGSSSIQGKLIADLKRSFELLANKYNLPIEDFPSVEKMKQNLKNQDFTKFCKLDTAMIKKVDTMLNKDLVGLMKLIEKDAKNSTLDTSSDQASSSSNPTSSNSAEKRPSGNATMESPLNKLRKISS